MAGEASLLVILISVESLLRLSSLHDLSQGRNVVWIRRVWSRPNASSHFER